MWTDDHLRLLIDERKTKNTEYHNIPGSSRVDFWNSIANTINKRFRTTYTGQQCNNRFQNLVRDYNSTCKYIAGSKTGKRSRAGELYFKEFNSHFWERPETPFDILHNTNTSTRKRRRNRTPPPTYEVTSILSTSRRESTTNQRNRSTSPIRRATSGRKDVNETVTTGNNRDNGNNVGSLSHDSKNRLTACSAINNAGGDLGNNTNNASKNLGNASYSSSSELANMISNLNTSTSRSDSDLSMPDVGDSQPPHMEPINEEGSL